MATPKFRLLMLSAMYENGGNTTHRLLDGHPQMFVYPFESQVGTRWVMDHLTSMFPVKYRWPVFNLSATPDQDYHAIIDEECKVRTITPKVSKFRHIPFDLQDSDRKQRFVKIVEKTPRTRGGNMMAFFQSTFDAWKDYNRTGEVEILVGYSPIIGVDGDKILNDLPDAHVLHVVRNPYSAYADTKKRPVPLSLEHYTVAWNLCQYYALIFKKKYPDRFHVIRTEDIFDDPVKTLGALCKQMGVRVSDTLKTPTWNGKVLEEVYPWGTIRRATPEANLATAKELSAEERKEVRERTEPFLSILGYEKFL